MPRSFTVERESLPAVVQRWIEAIGLGEEDLVELVFTERELLIRRPMSPHLRAWAEAMCDQYDRAFRQIVGI